MVVVEPEDRMGEGTGADGLGVSASKSCFLLIAEGGAISFDAVLVAFPNSSSSSSSQSSIVKGFGTDVVTAAGGTCSTFVADGCDPVVAEVDLICSKCTESAIFEGF